MAERPVQAPSSTSRLTGPQLVLAIGAVVVAISGAYAAMVLMASASGPEPPADLFGDVPVAAAGGVELYVAELVPGNSPVPMDPPTFSGELPTNEPISLRLVHLAGETADGEDLVIIWTRDEQELRRSRVVLHAGRGASSAVLSGTQTGGPGTYQVGVFVEDDPLTTLRFDVVELPPS